MAFLDSVILNEYLRFFFIFIGAIICANILHLILKTYLKRKSRQTKKPIYKKLLKNIIKPTYTISIFTGLYAALKSVTLFGKTAQHWLDNIFYIAFVLILTIFLTKVLSVVINAWLRKQQQFEKTPQIISKIITVIIFIIALLIILDHFQIETTPFLATLGLGGLALGLALQGTLTNFFAGLHLVSDKPVKIGDYIELNSGVSGMVQDIGWRSTRLRTMQNTTVIVPNTLLAESIITNNSSGTGEKENQGLLIIVECGVSYTSDLKKVERITEDCAKKIQKNLPEAVKDFTPNIRYCSFGDSNINFKVFLKAKDYQNKNRIRHEFIKALKEEFDKEGIEISWPVRKIVYEKEGRKAYKEKKETKDS